MTITRSTSHTPKKRSPKLNWSKNSQQIGTISFTLILAMVSVLTTTITRTALATSAGWYCDQYPCDPSCSTACDPQCDPQCKSYCFGPVPYDPCDPACGCDANCEDLDPDGNGLAVCVEPDIIFPGCEAIITVSASEDYDGPQYGRLDPRGSGGCFGGDPPFAGCFTEDWEFGCCCMPSSQGDCMPLSRGKCEPLNLCPGDQDQFNIWGEHFGHSTMEWDVWATLDCTDWSCENCFPHKVTVGHRVVAEADLDVGNKMRLPGCHHSEPDPEDEDDIPGTYIERNDDFDEGKDDEDWFDESPCSPAGSKITDDMKQFVMGIWPQTGAFCCVDCNGDTNHCGEHNVAAPHNELAEDMTITLSADSLGGNVRIYAISDDPNCDPCDPDCFEIIDSSDELADRYIHPDGDRSCWDFYVEGIDPGPVEVTMHAAILNSNCSMEDNVLFTVVQADLDIDSDNDNGTNPPERNYEEDKIEEDANHYGKLIAVNDDDDDGDGIIDLDDDDVDATEDDIVQLVMDVDPYSVWDEPRRWILSYDSSKIRLWSPYSAGDFKCPDPNTPGELIDCPDPATEKRFKDLGNCFLVESEQYFYVPDGGGSPSVPHTFYVEGIAAGQVDITFTVSGDGDGLFADDKVRLTVVKVDIDVDSDNDGDIDQADDLVEERFPGRHLWPNADDDDHDQSPGGDTPDFQQAGTVLNENDLAQIRLNLIVPSGFDEQVTLTWPADLVKVWNTATKGTLASGSWNASELPSLLWVEGLDQAGTAELQLSMSGWSDQIKITVFVVSTVIWETYTDLAQNTPIDQPTWGQGSIPPGSGWRIYPGKQNPNDQETDMRRRIVVRGVINPVPGPGESLEQGVRVFLKSWDVDDPSAEGNVVDNQPQGQQNMGPDNRGAPKAGTLFAEFVYTNGQGAYANIFEVTTQPGDNFVTTATSTPGIHGNYLEQEHVESGTAVVSIQKSDMLTVWRRLFVEVDSMNAVSTGGSSEYNYLTGSITNPRAAGGGTAWIEVDDFPGDFEEDDHFSDLGVPSNPGGRIYVYPPVNTVFWVYDTDANVGRDDLKIWPAPATPAVLDGLSYLLWDDDYSYTGTPPTITPKATLPAMPNASQLAQAYNRIYVEPNVLTNPTYYQTTLAFDRNIENSQSEVNARANANKNVPSSSALWAVHVTSAYQGPHAKDLDPGDEESDPGATYGMTAFYGGSTSGGALIFLETIRDKNDTGLEAWTVIHETGHQFLLEDGDGNVGNPDACDGDYIMTDQCNEGISGSNHFFSPYSSDRIRRISHPQPQ